MTKKSGRPPGRRKKRGLNADLAAIHAKRKAERAAASALASNDRTVHPPNNNSWPPQRPRSRGIGGGLDVAPPQAGTNSVEAAGAEACRGRSRDAQSKTILKTAPRRGARRGTTILDILGKRWTRSAKSHSMKMCSIIEGCHTAKTLRTILLDHKAAWLPLPLRALHLFHGISISLQRLCPLCTMPWSCGLARTFP